ncbi:MAG: YolD-like family protein [Lachnospiraceae bacterium]|nr:YolD-like family protein [Lachnospiraceae bacterium]
MSDSFENRADRAKQFAPFDALRGLREALEQKEKMPVQKIDLSDERKSDIDYKLHQISLNDLLTITYFHNGEYVERTGMVTKISPVTHTFQIEDSIIAFEDIYDIQRVLYDYEPED